MKNSFKRTTAAILATMMIGTGMYVPTLDHYNLFSQTSVTAEAASVGKPTGLKSKTLSNSKIKLTWKKVKSASGYTVYMRENGKYKKVANCKSNTYTVKKLPNASRKYFKVRAYKTVKGKKVYGAYSASWNTATNPQAAKGLKISSVSCDSVKLTWSKIGCTNYRVFQMINGSWKQVATTSNTSYTVSGLSEGTSYQFRIRACKQDYRKVNHYGKYSATVTATTTKSNRITQADIDAMKEELTAYSREKAEYIRENYKNFDGYGEMYNTLDEFFDYYAEDCTPEGASYDAVYVIPYTQETLNDTIDLYKRKLDYLYQKRDDVYYVVYIENCPNGHRVNSNPCWATYFLY